MLFSRILLTGFQRQNTFFEFPVIKYLFLVLDTELFAISPKFYVLLRLNIKSSQIMF